MVNRELNKLPDALLPWYSAVKRDLPWRCDKAPYHVWVSEIMLQQTRVEAVKGYYTRFLTALPTIADLANCDDDAGNMRKSLPFRASENTQQALSAPFALICPLRPWTAMCCV